MLPNFLVAPTQKSKSAFLSEVNIHRLIVHRKNQQVRVQVPNLELVGCPRKELQRSRSPKKNPPQVKRKGIRGAQKVGERKLPLLSLKSLIFRMTLMKCHQGRDHPGHLVSMP